MAREDHTIRPFIEEFYPEYLGDQKYDPQDTILCKKKDGEWGIFINFANTPITVNGVTFKCSETLFQTMKFTKKEDVMCVYKSNNKKMAEKLENNHTSRRPDWGKMVIDAMKFCLMEKYKQCEAFRNKLEESKGKFIVEDQTKSMTIKNPKRANSWGAKYYVTEDKYIGPNLLGRLLMELRDNDGKLELKYGLPDDALDFIETIKEELAKKA